MDEVQTVSGNKKKFIILGVVGLVLVLLIGASLLLLRRPATISPLGESDGGVRVIFVSPEPSASISATPLASASASATPRASSAARATPRSTPRASSQASSPSSSPTGRTSPSVSASP